MSGKVEGHKGPGSFSFHGRAGQGEWFGILVQSIFAGVAAAVIPYVGPVLSVLMTIRLIAVSTRRLHDLKASGWVQLVPMILMGVTIGLFFAFQTYGVADYSRFLGLDGLDPDIYDTKPTLSELLGVPANAFDGHDRGPISPLEGTPIVLWWVSIAAYVILYGAMLFLPGTNGPNPYGEADWERRS